MFINKLTYIHECALSCPSNHIFHRSLKVENDNVKEQLQIKKDKTVLKKDKTVGDTTKRRRTQVSES